MTNWDKNDFGKVISFKDNKGLDNLVVIYSSNALVPNTIGVVQYPIALHSKIVFEAGVPKNQEVQEGEKMKKAGDWMYIKKVSKDEMEELERIAKAPKLQYEEDVRDWGEFHTYPREKFSSFQSL